MRRTYVRGVAGLFAVALIAGCGGDDGGSDVPPCTVVSPAILTALEDGLLVPAEISDARRMFIGQQDLGINNVLAGTVDGALAVWAADLAGDDVDGVILPVNDHARTVSNLGAATEPGSPAANLVDEIAARADVAAVGRCEIATP